MSVLGLLAQDKSINGHFTGFKREVIINKVGGTFVQSISFFLYRLIY
jgi:hypothetical protein